MGHPARPPRIVKPQRRVEFLLPALRKWQGERKTGRESCGDKACLRHPRFELSVATYACNTTCGTGRASDVMEPRVDFFIIGAQKGGTTALDGYLRQHSHVQMARIKEVHYFDNEQIVWPRFDHELLHSQFDWRVRSVARGEATPIYLYWPDALRRIKDYNPFAKLIVCLRHPTFRAYSHWRMETRRGWEPLSFAVAISEEGRRRVKGSPGGVHRVYSYVERSFYAQQIKSLLEVLPRDQVHFLCTDALWATPSAALAAIEAFLGIERSTGSTMARRYVDVEGSLSEARSAIPPASRNVLDALFRSDIEETADLTGLDLSQWLSPHYAEEMIPVPD